MRYYIESIKGTLGPPHEGKTSSQMPTLLRVLSLFEPDGTLRKVAWLYLSHFRQFLIYFSSCTACSALDDAPAMFCLSLKKAAELHKFKEIMNKIFKITMFFGFNGLKMWEINSSNYKYTLLLASYVILLILLRNIRQV